MGGGGRVSRSCLAPSVTPTPSRSPYPLTQAGYFTIIDGIIGPRWFYESLRSSLVDEGLRVDYAILRPVLSVAINRAAERSSTRLADPAVIEQLWRGFTDLDASTEANAVIDTSVQTPDDTVP